MARPTVDDYITMAQQLQGQNFDQIALKLQELYWQGRTDAIAELNLTDVAA